MITDENEEDTNVEFAAYYKYFTYVGGFVFLSVMIAHSLVRVSLMRGYDYFIGDWATSSLQ